MALTIQQEPTQMNSAYTKLMYSVISTNRDQPQFKYLCDVKDHNGNLISRLRQGQNQANSAIFNVAIPCRGKLYEDDTFYITDPTASIGKGSPSNIKSYQQFKVAFGCEYGTSPSSSVTVYDGKGGVGDPAVSGSDLVLNRAVWEPWNEQQFLSSSANPVYQNSGTGSVNFFVSELAGANFVDVNLRINNVYPSGGFGGSGSFAYSASSAANLTTGNGLYTMDLVSFGVSSSAHRMGMEVYNMSTNQMVYQSSQGDTLPAGYVSGSVGGPQVLDTYAFTGSLNCVYGVRVNGIPTSSFNAPLFEAYYTANNYTASSDVVRSISYPVFPTNVIGVGGFVDTKAWQITVNTTSGSNVGDIDQVFPTLQDFSKANIPTLTPLPAGNFGSWNWNYQDSRINFTGSNPDTDPSKSPNTGKLYLTNWPSFVRNNVTNLLKNDVLKPVASNDWGTLSYYNISGSAENDATSRAIRLNLSYYPPEGGSAVIRTQKTYSEAQLNALTPLLIQSGSDADIPFVSLPGAPRNVPSFAATTGSDNWNVMTVAVGSGTEHKFFMLRDEPCEYETRSNFAFINKWGVWDFIGLNTPTNKNAVINERNEFMAVNADYNVQISSYNAYNRGFTQYYMNQDYKYQITSDPIPVTNIDNGLNHNNTGGPITALSEYYQELFTSPSVFLQVEDTFVPINITNSNFTYRTNIRGQKNYQVTIQYELSNKPRSRT